MSAQKKMIHRPSRAAERCKHPSRPALAVLAIASIMLVCGAGGSLAWITARSAPVENTFTPAAVTCAVREGATGDTFDGYIKENVRLRNTGNTDAYLRATIVANWVRVAADGSVTVQAQMPQPGIDYQLILSGSSDWVRGSDGYYYCVRPVAPNADTPMLIASCTPVPRRAPEGCTLQVQIIGEAVQAKGQNGERPVIQTLWDAATAVGTDGQLLIRTADGGNT